MAPFASALPGRRINLIWPYALGIPAKPLRACTRRYGDVPGTARRGEPHQRRRCNRRPVALLRLLADGCTILLNTITTNVLHLLVTKGPGSDAVSLLTTRTSACRPTISPGLRSKPSDMPRESHGYGRPASDFAILVVMIAARALGCLSSNSTHQARLAAVSPSYAPPRCGNLRWTGHRSGEWPRAHRLWPLGSAALGNVGWDAEGMALNSLPPRLASRRSVVV